MSEATKRLSDAIARAADRLDNLVHALALPVSPDIHLQGIRGTLPEIRDELFRAIGEAPPKP